MLYGQWRVAIVVSYTIIRIHNSTMAKKNLSPASFPNIKVPHTTQTMTGKAVNLFDPLLGNSPSDGAASRACMMDFHKQHLQPFVYPLQLLSDNL